MLTMYYVYALYSEKFNKIYIGYSENPKKRLASHNDYRSKGWTKKFQPWKLILTEVFSTKSKALSREKQLKTANGREYVWNIVKNS